MHQTSRKLTHFLKVSYWLIYRTSTIKIADKNRNIDHNGHEFISLSSADDG
jgi:hypothetical protein